MKNSLVIGLLLLSSFSHGAEFSLAGANDLGCDNLGESNICLTVLIEGEIVSGDENRLAEFVARVENEMSARNILPRVGKIHINSPGGDLYEAMRMGRLIRNKLMAVQVTQDSICYSACVVSYLGGVIRIPAGPIGIHSFYSEEFIDPKTFQENSAEYNSVSNDLRAYLDDMRIPTAVLDEMRKVPPSDLKILEFGELERLGVIGIDPVYSQMRSQK